MPTERGRDLDAAIAREVMGFRVEQDASGKSFILSEVHYELLGLSIIWSERGGWYQITGAKDELFPKAELVKRYSTDANAARLVLAEIERRHLKPLFLESFWLMRWDDGDIPGSIQRNEGETGDWELLTATPEAICLSALAAVRGGKG